MRRGAALVRGRDEPGARRDHRVGHVEVAAADHAEHVVDAVRDQVPADESADRHALDEGQDAARAARAADDRQRPGDDHRTRRRQRGDGCCSWVSPYLSLPSRNEWHGNGGSNECAAPASVPTVSTPTPRIGVSSASHFAHSTEMPGVRPRVGERVGVVAAGVPAGAVQQPAAGRQRPVLGLPRLDVLASSRKSGSAAASAATSSTDGRGDQPPGRHLRDVGAVLAGDPVDRRVEVGAGVLTGGDVVPVPGRAGRRRTG
jgi:hypothetical protein